jgi:NADH-quinone oxidoreductase subunit L
MSVVQIALAVAILAPLCGVAAIGLRVLLADEPPSERETVRVIGAGLVISVGATLVVAGAFAGLWGPPVRGDVEFGDWLRISDFVIPAVLLVDGISVTIAIFAATLTALIARFSRTYLHKEPGFALELFFAGWEIIGIASAFFIGFFHERGEPVRSAVRAFATYRLSDAGLLIATVTTFELLGSARFSAFEHSASLPPAESTIIALLFLLSAMGKSAQLPFSGWLPRAMEGPTPSSALFYGAVSIHAGLFLLLRVWPVVEVSLVARATGVVVGLSTAVYAAAVVRVHTDAKGTLAHATLAQVGLILAEICLGWTALALVHLVCHAFLRLGQYLKAPNTIHDSHRLGSHGALHAGWLERHAPAVAARLYAASLHRLRLDDRIDWAFSPVLRLASALDRADGWWRRLWSLDRSVR